MKLHPCNLTNIFIMIKLWHQRKQAFFSFFLEFAHSGAESENLDAMPAEVGCVPWSAVCQGAQTIRRAPLEPGSLTSPARCQMTSRGHRFPEQREGFGYYLLLDLDLQPLQMGGSVLPEGL